MKHDYNATCMCYRCKGIRNNPNPPRVKVKRSRRRKEPVASREEQYGRYLDCGPSNWDDRD